VSGNSQRGLTKPQQPYMEVIMTQLTPLYHTTKISDETILDAFYSLQRLSFQNTLREEYSKGKDGEDLLSCRGFSQEDLKWWLNTKSDLSKQLSFLVKSEKLLKFEAYLDDYQTLVEKYIPIKLYCKNYLDFQEIFEMKYGDFS
jgi:hypothetical protein